MKKFTAIAFVVLFSLVLFNINNASAQNEAAGKLVNPGGKSDREALIRDFFPLVKDWIIATRDLVGQDVAKPIPLKIKIMLAGFYGPEVLDATRYRVEKIDFYSLRVASFRLADPAAVTLDNIIVFTEQQFADNDEIWAHEIAHVIQYKYWGIDDFVYRYIMDFRQVEGEAEEKEKEYKEWKKQKTAGMNPAELNYSFKKIK